MDLLPTDMNRRSLLLAPFAVGNQVHVGLELFDKPEFTAADRANASACAEIGTDLIRHIVASRQSSRVLFGAVEAALVAADNVSAAMPAMDVVERLKQDLAPSESGLDAAESIDLIDAIRTLSQRHGPRAVTHCTTVVNDLIALLDSASGVGP